MLASSVQLILERLNEQDLLLDVGGWAKPLPRADWVLDLLPYETRGLYDYDRIAQRPHERFSADTWIVRDICVREPWPFDDGQFTFATCSHTLEDIRDPIWVCSELQRVARAGYVEVPSRLIEQAYGVNGPWVGWGHHRWLIDIDGNHIDFVFKHRILDGSADMRFSPAFETRLTDDQRVEVLWWDGSFTARERIFLTAEEAHPYFRAPIVAHEPGGWTPSPHQAAARRGLAARLVDRLR